MASQYEGVVVSDGETDPDSGGDSGGETLPPGAAAGVAFAVSFNFPGAAELAEAKELKGERSLMNDKPLFPFIEQLTEGSMRNFQSMPNGNFYGFFPDYFGGFGHRKPYWQIDDIEVLDGKIELSDETLVTHMYVVGDTYPGNGIGTQERQSSLGIVTIFDTGMADFINRSNEDFKTISQKAQKDDKHIDRSFLGGREDVLNFLQRYGARPLLEEASFIRSPHYEMYIAYMRFMEKWSEQFKTTFTFTFMPELYPGGIVAFPGHDIQMYIDEVHHQFSYEEGFTTQANLMAPAALNGVNSPITKGMVLAGSGDPLGKV
jgi:hypothetical protein